MSTSPFLRAQNAPPFPGSPLPAPPARQPDREPGRSSDPQECGLNAERLLTAYKTARAVEGPGAVDEQALTLPVESRQRLIFRLADSLGPDAPSLGVEKTPGVAGGSACLVRTRIPVWTLESYRSAGMSEEKILANFPGLRRADLVSAWTYTKLHRDEIGKDIRENDEA